MAEPVVPGERPAKPPASERSISRAVEHLRPFPPVSADLTVHRGAEEASTTHQTNPTGPHENHQNGSAHAHLSNGVDDATSEPEIPPLATVIARIHARVHAFLAETHPSNSLLASVQSQTRTSLAVVSQALAKYKLSELSVSYNGGKDCLVLLILFLAGLHPYTSYAQPDPKTRTTGLTTQEMIPSIYALPPDPFPAVEDFVVSSAHAYHLSITKYTTSPPTTTIRTVFEDYLTKHPGIRAIFVGTRRTDPHGAKLTHFDRTDHGWPDFMRVHPVIDWHYAEIWAFIRHLGLKYCSLYDMGYTSLGGTSDTHPNPSLRVQEKVNGGGERQYLPAYELTRDLEERLGRK